MSLKKLLTGFGVGALVFWILLVVMIIIMGVGTFIVPAMVPGWQAQGLKEAPVGWQILVDLSDFCKNRWYIAFPAIVIMAIVLSVRAMRQED